MRKKSHILLARWLVGQVEQSDMYPHKCSLYIGSVLPDCTPSFITRKHQMQETFEMVSKEIRLLAEWKNNTNCFFWVKMGEVLHYIADYFTFPHNPVFKGNLWEHGRYEEKLKQKLKEYVRSREKENIHQISGSFADVKQLITYLWETHDSYLKRRKKPEDDIRYIVRVCAEVFCGILRLQRGNTINLAA